MKYLLIFALLAIGCTKKPVMKPQLEPNPPVVLKEGVVMPEPVEQPFYNEPEPKVLNWPKGGTVLFEFDSYSTEDWEPDCDALMGRICSVVGFACPIGDAGYNQTLSENRAYAVAEKLKKCLVQEMDVIGKGETEDFGEYFKNRRVEFACVDGR